MIIDVFSIKDAKVGFMAPLTEVNSRVAIRNFAQSTKASGSVLGFSPADFTLYRIGTFDCESGLISPLLTPEYVASAEDFIDE